MRWIAAVLTVVATLTMMACGDAPGEEEDGGGATDQGVPALEAVTLDGDSVALADLRGEVVLVNVWATWCVPCRKEAPELEALHQRYGDRGLRVVGVTVDNRGAEAQIRQFVDRFGMTYDIWWDADGRAIDEFGAVGVPLTVLLDRDGRVAWRHLGAFTADNAALRAAVRSTL
ncbi:MAG: TlpA family protein disulfide reductase [Candidatus Longimicrobiales bacterium M2_2A_002]